MSGEGPHDGPEGEPVEASVSLSRAEAAALARRAALAEEKSALTRAVQSRIAVLSRRAAAVRGDLARLDEIEPLQRTGRLLLAQSASIKRGASKATLVDWETGGTLDITLNPTLSIKAQAEALFAKARRYKRGEPIMKKRLAEAEAALVDLASLAADSDASPLDSDALRDLTARARSLGALRLEAPSPRGRAPHEGPEERLPYTVFRGAGGSPIYVGRGAKDNDELTTKRARPRDLWLHAKGYAGAHVVVPLAKGATCPPELLVDAATLAAHFSDARGDTVCEVSYVEKRYVRKPRKSPPGLVTLDREKVIAVRIEAPRLSRLLASKERPTGSP